MRKGLSVLAACLLEACQPGVRKRRRIAEAQLRERTGNIVEQPTGVSDNTLNAFTQGSDAYATSTSPLRREIPQTVLPRDGESSIGCPPLATRGEWKPPCGQSHCSTMYFIRRRLQSRNRSSVSETRASAGRLPNGNPKGPYHGSLGTQEEEFAKFLADRTWTIPRKEQEGTTGTTTGSAGASTLVPVTRASAPVSSRSIAKQRTMSSVKGRATRTLGWLRHRAEGIWDRVREKLRQDSGLAHYWAIPEQNYRESGLYSVSSGFFTMESAKKKKNRETLQKVGYAANIVDLLEKLKKSSVVGSRRAGDGGTRGVYGVESVNDFYATNAIPTHSFYPDYGHKINHIHFRWKGFVVYVRVTPSFLLHGLIHPMRISLRRGEALQDAVFARRLVEVERYQQGLGPCDLSWIHEEVQRYVSQHRCASSGRDLN